MKWKPYDISYLFKRLCQVLEQVTIGSLDDELEAVILACTPTLASLHAPYDFGDTCRAKIAGLPLAIVH